MRLVWGVTSRVWRHGLAGDARRAMDASGRPDVDEANQ